MAKRMDGNETWFRVKYEVEYDIRYRRFNEKWDHTRKTSGDLDGDNPMYVYVDTHPVHEFFNIYLGPFNSMAALEREAEKYEEHYKSAPTSYQNLRIKRLQTETCKWEVV